MFNPRSFIPPQIIFFFCASYSVFVSADENDGSVKTGHDKPTQLIETFSADVIVQEFKNAMDALGFLQQVNPKSKKVELVVYDKEKQTLEYENGEKITLLDEDKIKELSSRISDFRQSLFNQFYQTHVNNPQAIIRGDLYEDIVSLVEEFDEYGQQNFENDGSPVLVEATERHYLRQQPKGLYTRYSDMLEIAKVQKDYVSELVNRVEFLKLLIDTHDQLKQLQSIMRLPSGAEKLVNDRFKEYRSAAIAFSIKENATFSFNDFLAQLENADTFLENARQIFFGVIAKRYVDVKRQGIPHSNEGKFTPVHMQTGLDTIGL